MTNLECVLGILEKHREARGWTDAEVAADLLDQLGLAADGLAKNPSVVFDDATDADDDDTHDKPPHAERRRKPAKR